MRSLRGVSSASICCCRLLGRSPQPRVFVFAPLTVAEPRKNSGNSEPKSDDDVETPITEAVALTAAHRNP